MKFNKTMFIGLLLVSQVTFAADPAFDITVNIKNIEKENGVLMLALVDDAADFPNAKKESTIRGRVPAKMTGSSYVFKGVKPGTYAVSIYQDLNNNQKLDTNFVGIPSEPYGVSGKAGFGTPKFKDCSFELKENKVVDIELKN